MNLYDIVNQYADLGIHRTGTDADLATSVWFADHLRYLGAKVDVHPFRFPRYDATWSVSLGGASVEGLPLFYGPSGRFNLRNIPVGRIDLTTFDEQGARFDLDRQIERAKSDGASGLLVETVSATGDVYAMNTHPDWTYDFPVMFIGTNARVASDADNQIRLDATLTDATANTVVGRFGHSARVPPLIITTPLSGWFTCSGERGTGIALSLRLAEALAAYRPVVLIAPSGHEFQYLGCRHHLASTDIDPASPVLHMGSCLATLPSAGEGLKAIAHVSDKQFPAMADALSILNMGLVRPRDPLSVDCWQGESEDWARFGCPMLSLAGVSPTFHTPGDTAMVSTTQPLLIETYNAILGVMKVMIAP